MQDARIVELKTLLPQTMLADWVRLGSRLVRLLHDQRHPATHDAVLDRLLDQARGSAALRLRRQANLPAISYPPQLPITARKDDILASIRQNQVVVIAGETGSGKTTQIPKICLEAGLGIEAKIGCTQPRRVAALSISSRIAEELNTEWGRQVGCKIRFDDRSSPDTYIKLMTDGILLAETQSDHLLSEYNAIIIDEAHERSLNIDFLLGYLKTLITQRPELKLIITSATINTSAFSQAFNNAPVIEVSGRMYPVEVSYSPYDTESEEAGDMTYIDAAVRATEQVLCEPGDGDVLIFMPGERDIRETSDQIKARFGDFTDIIPLYGRLGSGDQQRVFAPSEQRKIVVATNIAETSLTIPGIRYVIDAGLARISRYNPRTRTKRLPIEPISQSSANQRKGRCGRVRNGICIRLYSEQDFAARSPYTQPEIQRANLAEVILRMKAFHLGEIETFPFLDPPTPAAIQAGYSLLKELGALNDAGELTDLGKQLARLPIDPTLGRMLLQSQSEHATTELLIIASGLSIQDPRERPAEQKDAAAAAHRRFASPRSDFLSLLNIWNAVHEEWEKLRTQGQRRKFCKANFLSYLRMREWQDLFAQLHSALEGVSTVKLNESNAAYEAIHRSILAGLLGHVATRTERNQYKAASNKQVMLFPGSSLFERSEPPKKSRLDKGKSAPKSPASSQPEWIIAGEIVETSQVFARTVAGIDPKWIVELAPHLCRVTHQNPRWEPEAGQVMVEERITLYGLEVQKQRVAYGNINPEDATRIFIRSALVEENLFPETEEEELDAVTAPRSQAQLLATARARPEKRSAAYKFLEHNRQVRNKIEIWQTRMRRHDLTDVDEALFKFYSLHLQNVSSVHELNRAMRGKTADANFLFVPASELMGGQDVSYDAQAFPDDVDLDGQKVSLSYAYQPGEERDGVTLKLTPSLARDVSPAKVEWAVPGLRESQIAELLRALPKAIRRELMPFAPKVTFIARQLHPTGRSLVEDLSKFIREHFGIHAPVSAWPADALPNHLRPRIEIVGHHNRPAFAGRDLDQLRAQLETVVVKPASDPPQWHHTLQKWEKFDLKSWSIGELPERIHVCETATGPLYAWPGLQVDGQHVNLRVFRSQSEARQASLIGFQRLLELDLQKDLAWLQKDLRSLVRLQPLFGGFFSLEDLQADAFENLKAHLFPAELPTALSAIHFTASLQQARERLPGLAERLILCVNSVLGLRAEFLRKYPVPKAAPVAGKLNDLRNLSMAVPVQVRPNPLHAELNSLLPSRFLQIIPFERLNHLSRHLKALLVRAERAALNPVKDRERAALLAPYQQAAINLGPAKSPEARAATQEFRWMLEEYKVSLFAQELGTAFPISPKRLDQQLDKIRSLT